MNLISVIVPCWNEEETIPIYYEHMCPVMDAIDADCELIFVDDGSQDATLSEMKKLIFQITSKSNIYSLRKYKKQ